jgi:hypothetical protein
MKGVTLPPFTIDRHKFSFPPRHCEKNLTSFQEPRDWPADLEVTLDQHPNCGGLLRVPALSIIVNRNFQKPAPQAKAVEPRLLP